MSEILGANPERVEATLLYEDCVDSYKRGDFAVGNETQSAAKAGVFVAQEQTLKVGLFSLMKYDEDKEIKPCYLIAIENEDIGLRMVARVFGSGEAAAKTPQEAWCPIIEIGFLQNLRFIIQRTEFSQEAAEEIVS